MKVESNRFEQSCIFFKYFCSTQFNLKRFFILKLSTEWPTHSVANFTGMIFGTWWDCGTTNITTNGQYHHPHRQSRDRGKTKKHSPVASLRFARFQRLMCWIKTEMLAGWPKAKFWWYFYVNMDIKTPTVSHKYFYCKLYICTSICLHFFISIYVK